MTSTPMFNRLLLLSIVLSSSTAASAPVSEFPFEFNFDKGSTVTENNALTQAVSSDGLTVFKVNSPQPIKQYQQTKSTNNNGENFRSQDDSVGTQQQQQYQQQQHQQQQHQQQQHQQQPQNNGNSYSFRYQYGFPVGANAAYGSTFGSTGNVWNYFENLGRLFPGMKIVYR